MRPTGKASKGKLSVTGADWGVSSVMGSGGGGVLDPGSSPMFWVGGTGNWSEPAHWAISSGGTGGYSPPTSANTVTFDSNSGTAATVTGNVVASASAVTINKSDLTLLLAAAITVAGAITLTAGTFDSGAQTITTGSVNVSGSTARTLTLTNSTVNISGSGSAWNAATITNLTRTLTGSTINMIGATQTFAGGGIATYNNLNFSGGGTKTISGSNTYVNFTATGSSAFTDAILFSTNGQTITGTLSINGSARNARIRFGSNVNGTARIVTAAAVSLSNVDIQSVTGGGAASPFTGTSLGNLGGCTNITFTGAVTRSWVGNGGNWSDAPNHWAASSGGAPGINNYPLPQDTANIDASSITLAGQTIVADEPRYGIIDFTGVLNAPTFNPTSPAIPILAYGSITLAAGMTTTTVAPGASGSTWTWQHQSGTVTFTSNGVEWGATQIINALPSGTFQLADALITHDLALNAGTLTANNQNVTMRSGFGSTGALTRVLNMGSGTWTLNFEPGQATALWNISGSGLTLNASTSTIVFDIPSTALSNVAQFVGGGFTYNNFRWSNAQFTANALTVTGANTFAGFQIDAATVARSVTFPAAVTNTMTSFVADGQSGALLTLQSSTAASAATLSDGAGTNAISWMSIKDITAAGGATWNATNSTNVSGNTGITFL